MKGKSGSPLLSPRYKSTAVNYTVYHMVTHAALVAFLVTYVCLESFRPQFVVKTDSDSYHDLVASQSAAGSTDISATEHAISDQVLTQKGRNKIFVWSLIVGLVVGLLVWIVMTQM